MNKKRYQWKTVIIFTILILVGFITGAFFSYIKFKDSTQRITREYISNQEGTEKGTTFIESDLPIHDYKPIQNIKGETLDIVLEEYKEAVSWIRTMWSLRITLISILLSAFGLILARFYKPVIFFFLIPLIFFIDFTCTYTTLPFIYSCIYFEKFYFPNTHHIASNWNKWQSAAIHELVKKDDTEKIHNQFKLKYLIIIYKQKLFIYLFFIVVLCIFYFVLKSRKGLINSSNKFG